MAAITESEIMDIVYSFYEGDNDTWNATSDEYLTARRYSKAGILRWEYESGVKWKELFVKLSSAATGDKTTTTGDYSYTCPTDMRTPPSDYVWIGEEPYLVVPVSKVSQLEISADKFVYFTGNIKDGFTLKVNPHCTLVTGATIEYDYYKQASYYTTPTSTTEMENPMFLVHYILSRFYKNDGLVGEATQELQIAEELLNQMKENAFVVIDDELSNDAGFGQ